MWHSILENYGPDACRENCSSCNLVVIKKSITQRFTEYIKGIFLGGC